MTPFFIDWKDQTSSSISNGIKNCICCQKSVKYDPGHNKVHIFLQQ